MVDKMKAVLLTDFGGLEKLVFSEVDRLVADDGEVLIAVKACGVNPIDFKTRAGTGVGRWWPEGSLPAIIGWDISGVVVESKSDQFAVDDEVYTMARFPIPGSGYAEYSAVPAGEIAHKPKSADHVTAAAVPLAALTAWQALVDTAKIQAGQKVLVHAAAGGVGHFAVQIAKAKGCEVIGTASGRNEEFVRDLGVDQFIDYTKGAFEDAAQDVDVVFHMISPDLRPQSWQTMKKGGTLISITGPVPEEEAAEHGCTGTFISVRPSGEQLTEIASMIDAGTIKPSVEATYPLADVAKSHAHLEAGHTRGKVVLEI